VTTQGRRPLLARLLRLRHLRLRRWHTAVLVDGTIVLSVLLVLAELATAWTLLVLPLTVALVVKLHDVVAGLLARPVAVPEPPASPPDVDDGASSAPTPRWQSSPPAAATSTAPTPGGRRRREVAED
jgi:hypothetical protein